MRRFIASLPGKAISQVVILSMLAPMFSLMLLGKADAQVATQPTWAVLPYVVGPKATGIANLGSMQAEAVASELSKTTQYDIAPQEQIKRAADKLGLQLPVTDQTSLLRLGQELRASTLVVGEVVSYQIMDTGGGKQAVVGVNTRVIDVSSGLPVNGAGVTERSTVRVGNISDETLVSDAMAQAAAHTVDIIRTQTLPTGTVLNTTENTALINQGTRTGFKSGQKVIVVRGREQVATATITETEPDQAYLRADRVWKGIQPGDKVRVIFDIDNKVVGVRPNGTPVVAKKPRHSSNSGLMSVVLVLALGAFLLGGGRASSQNGAASFVSEATMFPDPTGSSAVRLKWSPDIFYRSNFSRVQWQIWRSDVTDTPVLVINGNQFQAYDVSGVSTTGTYASLADFNGKIGGNTCDVTSVPSNDFTGVGPVTGHAYQYKIELIYRVSSLDLPGGGDTGGTGGTGLTTGGGTGITTGGGTNGGGSTGLTTGGNTGLTTGGTNGGTTGGTNGGTTGGTGGAQDCYFITQQTFATGLSTPLTRSVGQSPANGASIPKSVSYDPTTQNITFTFSSANTGGAPLTLEYRIEASLSPLFPKGNTLLVGPPKLTSETGPISIVAANNFFQDIAPGTLVFWRIGVKNVVDAPGPVPDASGYRYVFGPNMQFVRAETPPPPPGP